MILRIKESGSYNENLIELNPQIDWSGYDMYEVSDRIEELMDESDEEFEDIMTQVLDENFSEDNWWYAEYRDIII